jgi:hypothetical protein
MLTNLPALSGSRPFIDPAGYASRALSSLTWTLVDATGATNTGDGMVVAQGWSISDRYHTTNWFQCVDLPLALGTNWASIQATDLAGSVAVTNFYYIFDTNGDTTAPALSLTWPQDGTQVSGDNFTVQAWMDDDTAAVALQYTDTNGILQTVSGLVERGGNVWVPSVPLVAGTNAFSLLATDAAGNVSTNTFSVTQTNAGLTISPIDPGLLPFAYAAVGGTVDDPNATVTVNGVPATVYDGGYWQVDSLPLAPGGTVVLQATAQLSNGATVQTLLTQQRDPMVFTQTYGYELDYSLTGASGTNTFEGHHTQLQWARGLGGTNTQADWWVDASGNVSSNLAITVWPPDNGYLPNPNLLGQIVGTSYYNGVLTDTTTSTSGVPNVEWMEESTSAGAGTWPEQFQTSWTESSAREIHLFTGGGACRQSQGLFDLSASLNYETQLDQRAYDWYLLYPGLAFWPFLSSASPPAAVPPQQITLAGLGCLDEHGKLWTMQPDGSDLAVTPKALSAMSAFPALAFRALAPASRAASTGGALPLPQKRKLVSYWAASVPANKARTTVGVGEQVLVEFSPSLQMKARWTTTGGSLSTNYATGALLIAPSNAANVTVTATVKRKTDRIRFTVLEPTGIDHAQITDTNYYSLGTAGAGMTVTAWVKPTSVSFYRVSIMELGRVSTDATGYFANTNVWPAEFLDHGLFGAGWWLPLGTDNSTVDLAYSGPCDPPWSLGSFSWQVPVIWEVGTSIDPTNRPITWNQNQAFTIDSSGTVSVQKFGYRITRTTNDVVTVETNL